jgi:hypothetical protein
MHVFKLQSCCVQLMYNITAAAIFVVTDLWVGPFAHAHAVCLDKCLSVAGVRVACKHRHHTAHHSSVCSIHLQLYLV